MLHRSMSDMRRVGRMPTRITSCAALVCHVAQAGEFFLEPPFQAAQTIAGELLRLEVDFEIELA